MSFSLKNIVQSELCANFELAFFIIKAWFLQKNKSFHGNWVEVFIISSHKEATIIDYYNFTAFENPILLIFTVIAEQLEVPRGMNIFHMP